jgi:hypothetical protein
LSKAEAKPELKQPVAKKLAVQVQRTDAEKDALFKKTLGKLKQILDVVFKKEDVRNRLSSILNPEKPQTSSRLTAEQVNFVKDAYWLAKQYPDLYLPMKDYADETLLTQMSEKGWGTEQSIKLVGAIEQSKAFQGMFGSVEPKKSRLPSFNKGETKQ